MPLPARTPLSPDIFVLENGKLQAILDEAASAVSGTPENDGLSPASTNEDFACGYGEAFRRHEIRG